MSALRKTIEDAANNDLRRICHKLLSRIEFLETALDRVNEKLGLDPRAHFASRDCSQCKGAGFVGSGKYEEMCECSILNEGHAGAASDYPPGG